METLYNFKNSSEKLIEKIVDDDFSAINHVILSKGDVLPEHYSNSNTYFIIVQGTMMLRLGEDNAKSYEKGSIVYIPYNIKMNIANVSSNILDFFIIKAPNPKKYKE